MSNTRILIVDDVKIARRIASRQIETHNPGRYTLLEAATVKEALDLLADSNESGQPIDLIITDGDYPFGDLEISVKEREFLAHLARVDQRSPLSSLTSTAADLLALRVSKMPFPRYHPHPLLFVLTSKPELYHQHRHYQDRYMATADSATSLEIIPFRLNIFGKENDLSDLVLAIGQHFGISSDSLGTGPSGCVVVQGIMPPGR